MAEDSFPGALASFRWTRETKIMSGALGVMLVISILSPWLAGLIVSIFLETIGGLGVLAYIILNVPFLRYRILTTLLTWKTWAYKPRSPLTQIFLAATRFLGGDKPKLWELQSCLPPLPVPPLKQTLDKYLESVKPLLTDEEFKNTTKAVEEFGKPGGVGEKLQAVLVEKSKTEKTSWLWDWWENIVYLGGRGPIALYSNWYGLDRIDPVLRSQPGRAANAIYGYLKFKKLVDSQNLEPNRVQGTVPLCMIQYSRIYGTVRIPGKDIDSLAFYPKSKHIVVVSKEQYFKVDVYDQNELLTPQDIQAQLNRILKQTENVAEDQEEPIGLLTSEDRPVWAQLRSDLIAMDEKNKATLEAIETALFMVVLDEDSPETVEDLAQYGILRKGKPLWYDKNFNVMIFKNGRMVANVDHTWADASVLVHVVDYVFAQESSVDHWVAENPDDKHLPYPKRLEWVLTPDVSQAIQTAKLKMSKLVASIDLAVLKFQYFGKGLIKKLNMSPDAFCQMAIQLAYFRVHGAPTLTYESAATVRYHHGRTETVRSCSNESLAFCKAMSDPVVSNQDKLKLLQAAIKKHVKTMRAATNGDGVDRHLLGLKILAKGSGMDPLPSIFTDKANTLEFKLSTSQTPALSTLGGGFSPLAADGYGVSYVVAEDRLWFHISSYTYYPNIKSSNLGDELKKALLDIHDMCLEDPKFQKVLSKRTYRVQRAE